MRYPGSVEPRFGAPKGQPVARGRSLTEFQKEFPDEAICAAFLFNRRNGMSARQLEDQLGLPYRTAWLLAQKLRRSMVDPDRELLEGNTAILISTSSCSPITAASTVTLRSKPCVRTAWAAQKTAAKVKRLPRRRCRRH